MKFYVSGYDAQGFLELFHHLGHSVVYDIERAEAVLFTGGPDVSPLLYGEYPHRYTRSSYMRDAVDCAAWDDAQDYGIPTVGVCRGAQFVHVMNGGKLIQHVEGHLGNHMIHTNTGGFIEVTSTHHQMIDLFGEGELLAYAEENTVPRIKTGTQPEVVWYSKTNSLAVQYHPEYMHPDSEGFRYFGALLKEYIQ